jgi:hypothetical protein
MQQRFGIQTPKTPYHIHNKPYIMSDNENVKSVASRDDKQQLEKYNKIETNILNHWKDDWFELLTTTGNIPPNDLYHHPNYYKEIPMPKLNKTKKKTKTFDNGDLRTMTATQLFPLIENEENRNTLNWAFITNNLNVTFNYMITHKDFPWHWHIADNKADFDVTAIITHDDILWDWSKLSCSKKVPLQFIIENKNKPWSWNAVCAAKTITVEIINNNPDIPWVWHDLQDQHGVAEHIIMKYIDKPWDWLRIYDDYNKTKNPEFYNLLKNLFEEKMLLSPNQTQMEYFYDEDEEEHTWSEIISRSSFLTPELLLKYKHLQFNWNMVTKNKQIPLDFIKQHMDLPWSFLDIVNRNDFKMDIVLENPEKEWNWTAVTRRATYQQIKTTPNLQWKWNVVKDKVYNEEQCEYVQNQLVKFMLLAMLNYYENERKLRDYELAEYVFANSYLIKIMIKY